jgi:hypothetical protein
MLEVGLEIALLVFGVDAHLVVQDTVHTQVLKADFTLHGGKLLLPVGAQIFLRSPDSHHSHWYWSIRANDASDICMNSSVLLRVDGRVERGCGKQREDKRETFHENSVDRYQLR